METTVRQARHANDIAFEARPKLPPRNTGKIFSVESFTLVLNHYNLYGTRKKFRSRSRQTLDAVRELAEFGEFGYHEIIAVCKIWNY